MELSMWWERGWSRLWFHQLKIIIKILYFSVSCCQTCLAREFLCLNLIGHFSHPNFFSSEWILRWTLISVTCLRQTWHCHSVTPVWLFLSWLRHFWREKKCLSQSGSGQINIRSDLSRGKHSNWGYTGIPITYVGILIPRGVCTDGFSPEKVSKKRVWWKNMLIIFCSFIPYNFFNLFNNSWRIPPPTTTKKCLLMFKTLMTQYTW